MRKLTYNNNDANAGPVLDWNNTSNPGNNWTLFNNEHYARGVDGKELATYTNNSLEEWYVWGTDMVGKIRGNSKYFFFKDHLGSVRGVIDNNFNLVSAQDFDAWGYLMENRVYNGDSTKHKFTGKERDAENLYDYFGARYYDSRIAIWTSTDPLMEKHFDFSPYNYVLRNPLALIDPDGKQISPMAWKPYQEPAGGIANIGALIATAAILQSIFDHNEFGELVYPLPVKEISVEALTKAKSKKLEGIESQISNIEEHLDKIKEMKPDDPDPHKVKELWKVHIAKAIQEAYKDFKQAFRKTGGKDFAKYLEETFGKERMDLIYEGLKSQRLKFEDYIK